MHLSPKTKSELAVAWCFALPAIIALYEIHTKFVEQNMHTGGGEQNAALFPRLLSWLLLFFIVLKTAATLWEAGKSKGTESRVRIFEPEGRKKLVTIFLIFVVYLLGLIFLGYYAATPLALAAFFLALGIRRVLPLAALSIGTTLFIWYAFAILLKVVLPVGRFGLYF